MIDTETTGTSREDRVVSFGAVALSGEDLHPIETLNLVFNPGRRSHPMAARVHGLSDEYLARQPPFAAHAAQIKKFLRGRVVVGHNLNFDLRLLDQDFAAAGFPGYAGKAGRYCTMMEYRHRFPGRSAKLSEVLATIGLARETQLHGALEDAVLTSAVLQWLHGYEQVALVRSTESRFANEVR